MCHSPLSASSTQRIQPSRDVWSWLVQVCREIISTKEIFSGSMHCWILHKTLIFLCSKANVCMYMHVSVRKWKQFKAISCSTHLKIFPLHTMIRMYILFLRKLYFNTTCVYLLQIKCSTVQCISICNYYFVPFLVAIFKSKLEMEKAGTHE